MRTRYVNRTISNIVATCNIYNTETKEIDEQKITLPAGVNIKKLDKEITKGLPNGSKLLEVVTTETVEATYRMPESQFVALATIVPAKETTIEE
nr:MAG TPA: hypothetical protein [Caudoviricetes sp.]